MRIDHHHQRGTVQLSTLAFIFLIVAVALPWILMVADFLPRLHLRDFFRRDGSTSHNVVTTRSGPWGVLELTPITISPLEFVLSSEDATGMKTEWIFVGYAKEQLASWLGGLDLTPAQQANLLDIAKWRVDESGITVTPSDETILTLTPATRLQIYRVLSRFPINEAYNRPWSIQTNMFHAALNNTRMNPATIDTIRRVAYTNHASIYVSDLPVILNSTTDENQKQMALRFLKSSATYLVSLRISPTTDVEVILQYWGERGRRKDLRPILNSLSQLPDGGRLDIAHLLPSFARQRLYIYPDPASANDGIRRDCHWTSLNFFLRQPNNDFGNSELAQQHILDNYFITADEPEFGDILFFTLPNGDTIHSSVYLAGRLVYTKNGETLSQPWIIMDVDELLDLYRNYYHSSVRVEVWRQQ